MYAEEQANKRYTYSTLKKKKKRGYLRLLTLSRLNDLARKIACIEMKHIHRHHLYAYSTKKRRRMKSKKK